MDEMDAYMTDKWLSKQTDGNDNWDFWEQLDGTSGHDQITINQRAEHSDPNARVVFHTSIYAGQGNDIITHKHQNVMDSNGTGGQSITDIRVWGGEGRDSFVVEGETKGFQVKDMEVGETITVAGKYKEAVEDGRWGGYGGRDTAVDGREFFNFEDKFGNDSTRVGVWLSEGTELQWSKGPNDTSVFTLVEV